MRFFLILYFFSAVQVCFAQDATLRHCVTNEHTIDFHIFPDEKKVKYNDTLYYYWFRSQKIHVTQGYSSGYLLEGNFTKYFVSGQLSEQGKFEYGLKNGTWKTWYESGQLATLYHYEEGILHGNYVVYNADGTVRESGNYKSGKFHGAKLENGETTIYKRGKMKKRQKGDAEKSGKEESAKEKKEKMKKSEEEVEKTEEDVEKADGKEKKFSLNLFQKDKNKSEEKEKNSEKDNREKSEKEKTKKPEKADKEKADKVDKKVDDKKNKK